MLCWLAAHGHESWRYADLSGALGLSASESHAAVGRLKKAQLVSRDAVPVFRHMRELFLHGFRFVFFPERGGMAPGVPTGVAGPALAPAFAPSAEIPVWPHSRGEVRGYGLKPLHRNAPDAAKRDAVLYSLLSLLDALRDGGARERKLAAEKMDKQLKELEQQHESVRPES